MFKKGLFALILLFSLLGFSQITSASGNTLTPLNDQSTEIKGTTTPNTPFTLTSSNPTVVFPTGLTSDGNGNFSIPTNLLLAGTSISLTTNDGQIVTTIVTYTGKLYINSPHDKDTTLTGALSPEYTFSVYANNKLLFKDQKVMNANGTFSLNLSSSLPAGTIITIQNQATGSILLTTTIQPTSIQLNPIVLASNVISGKSTPGFLIDIMRNNQLIGTNIKVSNNNTYTLNLLQRPTPREVYTVILKAPNGSVINKLSYTVKMPSFPEGKVIGKYKGATVEIVEHISKDHYKIRYSNGTIQTVLGKNLFIPKNQPTLVSRLSKEEIEWYVNSTVKKKKGYHVWVDLPRQRTYVLQNINNTWTLVKDMSCATGNNWTPTIRGNYTITFKKWGFYSENVRVHDATRFSGPYYFHSVLYNTKGTKIVDYTLGKKASHGCVRLAPENAKYISTLPLGTSVWIN